MKEKLKFTGNKALSINGAYFGGVPVSYTPHRTGTFTADIYGYIEEPAQFADMVTALELMEPEDNMIVNLQSNGGCASTTDMILHALRKTKGNVHFVATGQNASAATIILLEAQSFELSENFSALIHCGGLGDGGTLSEFRQSSPHHIKMMERLIRNTYAGFMSEKEIESMLDGKDYWMDAEEWCQRHEQRNRWMQEEMEKFEKAAQKALKAPKKPRSKKVDGKVPAPQYDPATVAFKELTDEVKKLRSDANAQVSNVVDYLAPPKV